MCARVCSLCVCVLQLRGALKSDSCRGPAGTYKMDVRWRKRLTDETVQVMPNLNHPRDIVFDWPGMEMGFLTQRQDTALL